MFVQYKSKQNKVKVLSYTDFVFSAYIIIYAGSGFFWDTLYSHKVSAERIIDIQMSNDHFYDFTEEFYYS